MFSGHCVKNFHIFSTIQLQSLKFCLVLFQVNSIFNFLVWFMFKVNIFLVMCGSVGYNSVLDYLYRYQKLRLMHKDICNVDLRCKCRLISAKN